MSEKITSGRACYGLQAGEDQGTKWSRKSAAGSGTASTEGCLHYQIVDGKPGRLKKENVGGTP